jgi:hypothetical protein
VDLEIEGERFPAHYDMTFTLTVDIDTPDGTRSASTSFDVYIKEVTSTSLAVTAPGYIKTVRHDPLYIILSFESADIFDLTYQWTCDKLDLSAIAEDWYILAIEPDTLTEGELYTFESSVTAGSKTGTTVTKVYVERSFTSGECSVVPDEGDGELDFFQIGCAGFLEIETGAIPSLTVYYKITGSVRDFYIPLSGKIYTESISRRLPIAKAEEDYEISLKLVLAANNGAIQEHYLTVKSIAPATVDHSSTGLDSFLDTTDDEDPESVRNALVLCTEFLDPESDDADEEVAKAEAILESKILNYYI